MRQNNGKNIPGYLGKYKGRSSILERILGIVGIVVVALALNTSIAAAVQYQTGDVFAGTGHGEIRHYDKSGNFIENLIVPNPGYTEAGMAFDSNNNLYSTLFKIENVAKFDPSGNFVSFFGSGYNANPESILFDASGNVYVGQADGSHNVLKFDSSGNSIGTFAPSVGPRGTDWIDLAKDQCTLFYTSEGKDVKRFDVCTNTQLPNFNTAPLPGSTAYALRILPDGGVLVADTASVIRLDSGGNQVQTYSPGGNVLFALNRDPDGTSFWTGGVLDGKMFKIDIASGAVLMTIDTTQHDNFDVLGGITVFGEQTDALGSISGQKFNDLNGNGVKDGGESGIVDWVIELTRPDGTKISQKTDASGNYNFASLLTGTYTVSEVLQPTWKQTAPIGGTYTISIKPADHEKDKDFGNTNVGSISGTKFEDVNHNGIFDAGEPVLPGWTIVLTKPDTTQETKVTDGSGNYKFDNLIAGKYTVGEQLQNGYIQTAPAVSVKGTETYAVDLKPGENVQDKVFGNYKLGVVSGQKFNDINGNSKKDAGDVGLGGWQINLNGTDTITNTPVSMTTTTDGSGNYNFPGLTAGTYTINETLKNGWIQTAPGVSTTGSATYTVTIGDSGTVIADKDFGNFKLGEVDGQKFEDLNANGIKDNNNFINEVGLAGWNITINGTDTITNTPVSITKTTDANGNYQFTGLTAGTYTITETLQNGWVQTAPSGGSYTVIITSGTVTKGQDFGNFHKGKITGGGWITIPSGDPKATFGIVGQYPDSKSAAQGNVEYQDHIANLNIKSIQINTVATTLDKKKGAITGLVQVNGAGSYPFVVYVEDNAEPGKGIDVFKISVPAYPYLNGAILTGGNIQIHE